MSLERSEIVKAINATKSDAQPDGNVTIAARRLGAARRTLQNRMRSYGMSRGRAGRPKRSLKYKRVRASSIAVVAGAVIGAVLLVRASRKTV